MFSCVSWSLPSRTQLLRAVGLSPLEGAAAASRKSLDPGLVLLGAELEVGVVLMSSGSLLSQRAPMHPLVWSPSLAGPGCVGPQAAPEGEFGSFSLWEGWLLYGCRNHSPSSWQSEMSLD